MVYVILAISALFNVIWFPATYAAKLWFFQWAAIWWFGLGLVSCIAAVAYFPKTNDELVKKLSMTLLAGPVVLVAVIDEIMKS